MERYVVSDLHLDHANIIDYCDRPFDTVKEMNQTLIENWNTTVGTDDIVFFLGDLGHFADEGELRAWLSQLHGRVVFIEGNHDHPSEYIEGVNTHQYYILEQGEWQFCCTHRPENVPAFWEGWLIHGHHHNNHPEEYPFIEAKKRRVNVSVEVLDYRPLNINTLVTFLEHNRSYTTREEAAEG